MGTIHAFPAAPAAFCCGRTLSSAIQRRREYVTREIASLCRQGPRVRVLCIGLSALRDLEAVLSDIEETAGEIVVLERNECRVEAIRDEASCSALEIVPVEPWPLHGGEFGRFDFIYAPHVLNSLDDASAKRCLARLASILKRGGRLLLSSFSPEVADSEYPLQGSHVRSEEQLSGLADHIPDACFAGQIQWRDESGLLVFLEIHR